MAAFAGSMPLGPARPKTVPPETSLSGFQANWRNPGCKTSISKAAKLWGCDPVVVYLHSSHWAAENDRSNISPTSPLSWDCWRRPWSLRDSWMVPKKKVVLQILILLMEEILHQLIGTLSHLKCTGLYTSRWYGISSINSIFSYCIISGLPRLIAICQVHMITAQFLQLHMKVQ